MRAQAPFWDFMIIIDDLVTWPFSGLLWIVQEISNAASEDRLAEADALRGELRLLYVDLERGAITEADFDRKESQLLDQLDRIEEAIRAENSENEESADDLADSDLDDTDLDDTDVDTEDGPDAEDEPDEDDRA